MDNETREMLEAQGNRLTKVEAQTAPIPQMQADLQETQADVKETQAYVKQMQADVKETQAYVKQMQADVADIKIDVAWIRGMLEERARNEDKAYHAKTRLGMWLFGGVASVSALLNVIQWLLSIRPSP